MNKFHQIPTDKFVPISHDNSYLFNHYDKVANFLAFNLEKNYKNILAKPVQNGYIFDWFSTYENLESITAKPKNESEIGLLKYWGFIEVLNTKIEQLSNSNDENNKNWANLLTKVFNHQDNFIFSNGKDICIVWGWKFDNNENYKPNLINKQTPDVFNDQIAAPISKPFENNTPEVKPIISSEETYDKEKLTEDQVIEETPIYEEIIKDESNFLNFLKWFASKYWWLLWLLTFFSALVFFYKTFYFNNY